jgi:hypothetical protein
MQKVFTDLEVILSSYVDKFAKTDKFHLVGLITHLLTMHFSEPSLFKMHDQKRTQNTGTISGRGFGLIQLT